MIQMYSHLCLFDIKMNMLFLLTIFQCGKMVLKFSFYFIFSVSKTNDILNGFISYISPKKICFAIAFGEKKVSFFSVLVLNVCHCYLH